jgi:poly-gamma-glutamate synthesis protein (capsule biosynthesis protein)
MPVAPLAALVTAALLPFNAHSFSTRARRADLTTPLPADAHCAALGDRFTLAAVGDLLLHANIQAEAARSGFDSLFDPVRPYLEAADLSYANFEGSVNPALPTSSFPEFNYRPELADAVAEAGFDVVSTANNHALDTGYDGLDGTLAALDAAGVVHHGTTATGQEKVPFLAHTALNRAGQKLQVGFLSFTFGTNEHPDPDGRVNMLWTPERTLAPEVLGAVRAARAASDLVVVALHWGIEYHFLPEPEQRAAAEALAEAGADLILGDHPHTLQPPAWVGPPGHESLCIFSLGNFIAAQGKFQAKHFTQTSIVLYVGVAHAAGERAQVVGYRYLPVYIERDLQPVPIRPGDHRVELAHVRQQLRDPRGEAQLPPDPGALAQGVPVCSSR